MEANHLIREITHRTRETRWVREEPHPLGKKTPLGKKIPLGKGSNLLGKAYVRKHVTVDIYDGVNKSHTRP